MLTCGEQLKLQDCCWIAMKLAKKCSLRTSKKFLAEVCNNGEVEKEARRTRGTDRLLVWTPCQKPAGTSSFGAKKQNNTARDTRTDGTAVVYPAAMQRLGLAY